MINDVSLMVKHTPFANGLAPENGEVLLSAAGVYLPITRSLELQL